MKIQEKLKETLLEVSEIHLHLFGLKAGVELVGSTRLRLRALRLSEENLGLDEDTQARVKSLFVQLGGLSNIIVRDSVAIVKQQHDGHLVGRDLEGWRCLQVRNLAVVGLDLTLAQLP